jgi:cation-transporting ATPase 13A2
MLKLRAMFTFTTQVTIIRGEKQIEINSKDLVPGDIYIITDSLKIPCDCILVQGHVLTNEASLTGESNP